MDGMTPSHGVTPPSPETANEPSLPMTSSGRAGAAVQFPEV
jgi:hypothetical protein